ncbi:MAG TPA: hypothetical protein VIL65_13700 [Beijerinckiaceae bacterium]|jgi:hypothetical protein
MTPVNGVFALDDPAKGEGTLQRFGGSKSDLFNNTLIRQVLETVWVTSPTNERRDELIASNLAALHGINPRDEVEGMLGAQMVACHNAAMECYRRAMIPDQSFEGRKENLTQANKLTRSYTTLMDALGRHRGKGQQKVTVEHVHVHAGGQAIVGTVEGGGVANGNQRQPHAKRIEAVAHAPVAPLRSQDPERAPVCVAGDAERAVSHARGSVARRPER